MPYVVDCITMFSWSQARVDSFWITVEVFDTYIWFQLHRELLLKVNQVIVAFGLMVVFMKNRCISKCICLFVYFPPANFYKNCSPLSISRSPFLYHTSHSSADKSKGLDAACMFAPVPWPGGGTRCAAEGLAVPACHQALSEPGGPTRPQLGGQKLQAAGRPPTSKDCGCQKAGSRYRCCWKRPTLVRIREAVPGTKLEKYQMGTLDLDYDTVIGLQIFSCILYPVK